MSNSNWLREIASPENAMLDIVAVHGMNICDNPNHADATWTDKSTDTNWLRDLLPECIPYARILAYQYNANVVFQASIAGVEEQAKNLLVFLSSERKSNNSRPIVFIAHSLGGLIVKQALATAFNEDGAFATISTMTYGIAFFAVPHNGSPLAPWGKIVADIVSLYSGPVNTSFLESVSSGSEASERLNAQFEPLLEHYRFFSFCETLGEKKGGIDLDIVVPKESAVLGLPDLREVKVYLNRSHSQICKFSNAEDPEWESTRKVLCQAAEAARSANYTPTLSKRQDMFKSIRPHHRYPCNAPDTLTESLKRAQKVLGDFEEETVGEFRQVDQDSILGFVTWALALVAAFIMPSAIILSPLAFALAYVLPSKSAILTKAEEGRAVQQRKVEHERRVVDALDAKLEHGLQAIEMLRVALPDRDNPEDGTREGDSRDDGGSAHDTMERQLTLALSLQKRLDEKVAWTIEELHRRNKVYAREVGRLERLDEAREELAKKDGPDFYLALKDRVEEEQDREENKNDGGCPCVIL